MVETYQLKVRDFHIDYKNKTQLPAVYQKPTLNMVTETKNNRLGKDVY